MRSAEDHRHFIAGVGPVHFWGFTPAQALLPNRFLDAQNDSTFACEATPVVFFMHETCTETLARSIASLDILRSVNINHRERVEMCLDLHCNALVRDATAEYLRQRCSSLAKMVRQEDDDGDEVSRHGDTEHVSINFDFSKLKHRDRDELAEIFESWISILDRKIQMFDIEKLRMQRLRWFYGDRFECRVNLVDWFYQMELKSCLGADIIHWQEFKSFALTGTAHSTRLVHQTVPNPSLSSFSAGTDRRRGQSVEVIGYWGDIIISPFISLGIDTDDADKREELWKTHNNQRCHGSQEVMEYNLNRWTSQLEAKECRSSIAFLLGDRLRSFCRQQTEKFDVLHLGSLAAQLLLNIDDEDLCQHFDIVAVDSMKYYIHLSKAARLRFRPTVENALLAQHFSPLYTICEEKDETLALKAEPVLLSFKRIDSAVLNA